MTLSLVRSQRRPARPRTRAAGPRAAEPAPVLVEATNYYVVRRSTTGHRTFRAVVMRHADGSLWTHYIPQEDAA